MDDKNAARQIASIFGRSCREPSNDPGLDPALDSAAEVIARIRAEARAEALQIAEKQSLEWFAYVSNDYDHDAPRWAHRLAEVQEAERATILAGEPKEAAQCLTCGKQCPNGCPMDEPEEERGPEDVADGLIAEAVIAERKRIMSAVSSLAENDFVITDHGTAILAEDVLDVIAEPSHDCYAEVERRIEEAGR